MLDAVNRQVREINPDRQINDSPVVIARIILDSLALRYTSVLRTIERLTDRKIKGVRIVGGGSRNSYLNQATATASGLPVIAGPIEATVIGNVLVQAISAGRFGSLAEARRCVSQHSQSRVYEPQLASAWAEKIERYYQIEQQYLKSHD
jgi:rhamnulokinase